jgi:Ca-activated chloride channel family protein
MSLSELVGRGSNPGRWVGQWVGLLLCLSCALAQTSDFRISTNVNLVMLDVSARDTKGTYVSGLTKDNFHVYEDDVEQKITAFSSEDMPVTVGLVMDDSGSMRSKRADVITAGMVFIGASNPKDQIFVVNFNDKVRIGLPESVPFTDNIKLLGTALSRDPAAGKTSLYDAVAWALGHLDSGSGRKALLIVSDGGDNTSQHSLKDVTRLIQESRATVYTIGIYDPDDPDQKPQVLRRFTSVSGGESFLPKELDEVTPICRKIAKDIRARYTIGYVPTHTRGNSQLHKIRLTASGPNHEKIVVRTRSSYQAPDRE